MKVKFKMEKPDPPLIQIRIKPERRYIKQKPNTYSKAICLVYGGDVYPASKITDDGWAYLEKMEGWICPNGYELLE